MGEFGGCSTHVGGGLLLVDKKAIVRKSNQKHLKAKAIRETQPKHQNNDILNDILIHIFNKTLEKLNKWIIEKIQ